MNYSEITADQQQELLNNGTALLRTITEIWGADIGMKMWDNIADTVGADFKGAVFFALMTGGVEKLEILQRAECIKRLRDLGCQAE